MTTEVSAAAVAALVADVLGIARDGVGEDTDILTLPGFSSATLLRIVDGLEQRLSVEFPPEALVAATFASPVRVAEALGAARR